MGLNDGSVNFVVDGFMKKAMQKPPIFLWDEWRIKIVVERVDKTNVAGNDKRRT